MKTETLNIESLIPYAKNSRTHSAEQVAQIASSIREFGWTNPVLIDGQGTIIAGHGRVMAARALSIVEIPCIRLTHLSDSQIRAYVIADNKLALNAGWDEEMLNSELRALAEEGDIVKMTGFSDEELAALLEPETELHGDPDEVPEPPVDPITKVGDLWTLGRHRVLCGDSTKAEDVGRLLAEVVPVLMVTDPPYGVEYDADWRNHALRADGSPIAGRAIGKVTNDDRADWREAWTLFPGDVAYVWHAGNMAHVVAESLIACELHIRSQIVWAKSQLVIGRGDYHPQHEPCWYCVRKGKPGLRTDDRKQTTLWEIDKPRKSETGHSTQKPIECMARPMQNHHAAEVYDPFLGSGTTLIAAEQLGRKCYGMEISPAYCDVIINRWQNLTGKTATHAVTGKPFNDRPAA